MTMTDYEAISRETPCIKFTIKSQKKARKYFMPNFLISGQIRQQIFLEKGKKGIWTTVCFESPLEGTVSRDLRPSFFSSIDYPWSPD
jgi:hypothetical protein